MKKLLFITTFILLSTGSAFAQINLDSMLVAYFPFNGNANDESVNNNNGTIYGATLTADRFGNDSSAYYFNGINHDYIDCGNDTSLDITESLTISAWIKPDSTFGPVVTKWKTTPIPYWGGSYYLTMDWFSITYNGYGPVPVSHDKPLDERIFYHLVGIYNYDTDSMFYYVDGVLSNVIAVNGGEIPISTSNILIGATRWYAPSFQENYFHGVIDEVRIYKRAITNDEITYLFNGQIPISVATIDNEQSFKSYPNPFSDKSTIEFNNPDYSKYKLSVFNSIGELVFFRDNITTNKIEFERKDLQSGIYLIKLSSTDKIISGKLVIE